MKKTPLTRKTPLGAKKGFSKKGSTLKANKPLKQMSDKRAAKLKESGSSVYSTLSTKRPLGSTSSLKTKKALPVNSTLKSTKPLKKQSDKKAGASMKPRRNSMKGHGRTSSDIAFHTRIVSLGCAACNISGQYSLHPLQVHHPEGRSRGAIGDYKERFALCLCAEHHDQRIYNGFMNGLTWVPADKSIPSVHHAKKSFYNAYGSEHFLVHEQYIALEENPPWLTPEEWQAYQALSTPEEKELWLKETIRSANASERRLIAAS